MTLCTEHLIFRGARTQLAPPSGLFLEEIVYPSSLELREDGSGEKSNARDECCGNEDVAGFLQYIRSILKRLALLRTHAVEEKHIGAVMHGISNHRGLGFVVLGEPQYCNLS